MVLIVDDNVNVRNVIKQILEGVEGSFCECGDGSEVLDMYARCSPDWVLMDIAMPRVDGITATRMLKASHPGARILIVTEHNDPDLRAEAMLAGALGFVSKEDIGAIRKILLHPAKNQELGNLHNEESD